MWRSKTITTQENLPLQVKKYLYFQAVYWQFPFHGHLNLIGYIILGICLLVVCFSTSFWLWFGANTPTVHATSSNWLKVLLDLNFDCNYPPRRITHVLQYSWPLCSCTSLNFTGVTSTWVRATPRIWGCFHVEDWSVHSSLIFLVRLSLTHAAAVLQLSGQSDTVTLAWKCTERRPQLGYPFSYFSTKLHHHCSNFWLLRQCENLFGVIHPSTFHDLPSVSLCCPVSQTSSSAA